MIAVFGLFVAVAMFMHVKRHLDEHRQQWRGAKLKAKGDKRTVEATPPPAAASEAQCGEWQRVWAEKWAEKFQHKLEREQRRWERHAKRAERRWGVKLAPPVQAAAAAATAAAASASAATSETQALYQANRRAKAEVGFYIHLMSYLGVIALLALINMLTTALPVVPVAGARLGHRHLLALHGGVRPPACCASATSSRRSSARCGARRW